MQSNNIKKSSACEVCDCDPCDCDWGHNECSEIVIYVKSRSCRVTDRKKVKIVDKRSSDEKSQC